MIQSLLRYSAGLRHLEHLPGNGGGKTPVVLVHGLLHRGVIMRPFGLALQATGRDVWIYDYRTTRHHIGEHGAELAAFLLKLRKDLPEIDLVTHSMGGLLARVALDRLRRENATGFIRRVVMLAPPNHGSDLAAKWVAHFAPAPYLVRPLPDLSSTAEAPVHRLPVPAGFEIGIIAARFDSKVALDSTHLQGETDHTIVDTGHAFMMNHPDTRYQTCFFLEHGHFDHAKTS